MKLALYILSIFSAQPMVVLSWGVCKFGAIQDDRGIIFHVQGYKFNGWVKVIYDKRTDLFNIHYLTNKMNEVEEQQGIYFDMLVETIDCTVEKCTNYEQRVKQQYALV